MVERVLETPHRWSDRQKAQAAQLQVKAADRDRGVAVERRLEAEAQRDRANDERDRALAEVAAATAERDQGIRDRDQAISDRDQVRELLAVTEADRDRQVRESRA